MFASSWDDGRWNSYRVIKYVTCNGNMKGLGTASTWTGEGRSLFYCGKLGRRQAGRLRFPFCGVASFHDDVNVYLLLQFPPWIIAILKDSKLRNWGSQFLAEWENRVEKNGWAKAVSWRSGLEFGSLGSHSQPCATWFSLSFLCYGFGFMHKSPAFFLPWKHRT